MIENQGIGLHCYGRLELTGRPPIDPPNTCYMGIEMAEPFRIEQMPEGDRQKAMTDIVEAIARLHALGIWHGDIKPNNICLKHNRAYLIDFEFATVGTKRSRGNGTRYYRRADYSLAKVGTLLAQTPRQRDFFALGVLMVELQSGGRIRDLVPDPKKTPFNKLFSNCILMLKRAKIPLGVFIRKLVGLDTTFPTTVAMLDFYNQKVSPKD
jgi:serine/threonine protein kinase